jgi:hypothetical protein
MTVNMTIDEFVKAISFPEAARQFRLTVLSKDVISVESAVKELKNAAKVMHNLDMYNAASCAALPNGKVTAEIQIENPYTLAKIASLFMTSKCMFEISSISEYHSYVALKRLIRNGYTINGIANYSDDEYSKMVNEVKTNGSDTYSAE